MGVASAEDPAPRAVAWGWRGRARRWAGRGNREERAGPVCSCPCLALGRGRASARAGGKPARTAVVGFDWRGGEVTCERLRPPRPNRAGLAGPHAPCEAGAEEQAESAPGVGDEEEEESHPWRRRPRPGGLLAKDGGSPGEQ